MALSSVGWALSDCRSEGSCRRMALTSEAMPLRRTRVSNRLSRPANSDRTASEPERAKAPTRYSSCSASTSFVPGATSRASRSAAAAASHCSRAYSALALRTYALTKHGSNSSARSASASASSECSICRCASARLACKRASSSSDRPYAPTHARAIRRASPYCWMASACWPALKAALPACLAASTAIAGSMAATVGEGALPCSCTDQPVSGASVSLVWKP
mmetsp:Transcript_30499/g.98546  ORF Transcript_30499/g.98546 Transcript_30499/m.98546 type:complete len:220 (-) Transcript_30499:508-1167(-)